MVALRFYNDARWKRLAKRHLKAHPWCSVVGCEERAFHVDHIETIEEAPHRRLDPTNLQGLCANHHNVVTAAYDSGTIRGACDANGSPLDPEHPWNQPSNRAATEAVNQPPSADPQLAARLKRRFVLQRTR